MSSTPRAPSPRRVPWLSGTWITAAILASITLDVALLVSAGLRVDISWASLGFAGWMLGAGLTCYALREPVTRAEQVARDLTEGVTLFALISLLGAVASYPLAAGKHGLVDPELERVDLLLHFHWVSWYEVVARHVWLQPIERLAYFSIFVTPAVLLGYFAWTGRRAESRLFVATFWVTAVITLGLFPLFPAAGPLVTLWRGAMPYMPLSALYQEEIIAGLRHHAIHAIDLGALHGLVSAPSFHAASAVVYLATAFRIAPLRWPMVAANVAMLLATPVEGTHYLVDLLSGMLVALAALLVTPVLIQWTDRAGRRGPRIATAVSIASSGL